MLAISMKSVWKLVASMGQAGSRSWAGRSCPTGNGGLAFAAAASTSSFYSEGVARFDRLSF